MMARAIECLRYQNAPRASHPRGDPFMNLATIVLIVKSIRAFICAELVVRALANAGEREELFSFRLFFHDF